LEFVLDTFRSNFAGYALYVIDGHTLVEKTLGDYQRALERNKEFCEHYASFPSEASYLLTLKEDNAELKRRMTHLEMDRPRLVAFYRDTGAYQLGEEQLVAMGLPHHWVSKH
jgi:hypothetical protein